MVVMRWSGEVVWRKAAYRKHRLAWVLIAERLERLGHPSGHLLLCFEFAPRVCRSLTERLIRAVDADTRTARVVCKHHCRLVCRWEQVGGGAERQRVHQIF